MAQILEVTKSNGPLCVLGVADTERGRAIEKEMVKWLRPIYHLYEVWHDGTLFEQPALRFMQDLVKETGKPCLYLHTRGAYNFHKTTTKRAHRMWKNQFGALHRNDYFSRVCTEVPTAVCPFTGKGKHTWYNGFVVNAQAMKSIPAIVPSEDRLAFECIFKDSDVHVIGLLSNDLEGNGLLKGREYLMKHY